MTIEIPHECKPSFWRTQDFTWQCPVCGSLWVWANLRPTTVPGVPAEACEVYENKWVNFEGLVDCLAFIDHLKRERLDKNVHWILPKDFLPGVQVLWGYPVVRAEIPHPMIGTRP